MWLAVVGPGTGVLRNQTVEDMPHVEEAIWGVMIETASVGPEVNESGNGEGPSP